MIQKFGAPVTLNIINKGNWLSNAALAFTTSMQLYRHEHLLLPSWTQEELVELEETAQQHLFQPQQPNTTKEYLLQPSTMLD